jgi:hypothetical protein
MQNAGTKSQKILFLIISFTFYLLSFTFVYATPTTHIWAPSTDVQAYKKWHITSDFYFPTTKKDASDNYIHVNQVYGLTVGVLPDLPSLKKVQAEAGFDYKKGYGSALDTYPWYFNFKLGLSEDAYFKNMPALAIGAYDLGTKHNKTDYDIWYLKAAKTLFIDDLSLGRFSLGYFKGNGRLLRDENDERDNSGILACWERTMTEISDRLWLAAEYQGTHSSYGTLNFGFAWKFTNNMSAIVGYDIYNNRNNTDTVTLQIDIDF